MAAEGTVTDLGASVTTTAKGTEDSETLDGMIEVQADLDPTEDVAVLQLKDAEDLQPATIDDDTVDVGDDVTAVGNSEGGGRLMAAEGTVTDLGASVTTTAKGTEDSETLDGMIEVQAD